MNDGKNDELEDLFFDIYTQEFYLHSYSLLRNYRNLFQDSHEGYTYVPIQSEEKVT